MYLILMSNFITEIFMSLQFIDYGSSQYNEMVDLRRTVLRKPFGLDFDQAYLDMDKDNILLGCYDDDILEGCCQLKKIDKKTMQLRQLAVANGLQGKGIGKALLRFAETVAKDLGYKRMYMHARQDAKPFFERCGYVVYGEPFEQQGIPHLLMEKIFYL